MPPFFLARPIDSSLQITPSESFFLDLQTCTQTWPEPLTRILNVGLLPAATVALALGESGVMPLAAWADARERRRRPAAASTRTSWNFIAQA